MFFQTLMWSFGVVAYFLPIDKVSPRLTDLGDGSARHRVEAAAEFFDSNVAGGLDFWSYRDPHFVTVDWISRCGIGVVESKYTVRVSL